MTNLDAFECPNCGAKVERPAEGQTTKCPFCSAELSAPEAAVREVVVREVVRERVIEQAPPVVDYRTPLSTRTRIMFLVGVLVAGGLVLAAILSSAKRDSEQRQAKSDAKASCEKSCKQSCAKEFAAPPAAAKEPENSEAQMARLKREGDETICESDCTTRCYR